MVSSEVGASVKSSKDPVHSGTTGAAEDPRLVDALRRGEEAAFVELVERYHPLLLGLARLYVPTRAIAEDVVQETWLGVLKGIDRFESRSSLKTWISGILINQAKTHARSEKRLVPFSSLVKSEIGTPELSVEPERFLKAGEEWPGHWALPPESWGEHPEKRLLAEETMEHIQEAIAALPSTQQMVITLRDLEGWTSEEVCNVLEISETHQRVLLHRARSKVRSTLEKYFETR